MMNDDLDRSVLGRLRALPAGRHYGSSQGSECWVMVGRALREVEEWTIVPPAASLTYAWGEGGCALRFDGGALTVGPGDWMWIDRGFAHHGRNAAGSDFVTLFVPDRYAREAALDALSIGAAAASAPPAAALLLCRLAVMLLDGQPTRSFEIPAMHAILDHVGRGFPGAAGRKVQDDPAARAAAMLRADADATTSIARIADRVGLSGPELSRQFNARHALTPAVYRRQLMLARATRALAKGGTVTAAAHDAGFADGAHLARTFRAQYGTTPSDWVRRLTGRTEL